ncbi:MAG: hypothetical protein DMG98_18875 [Acidobacteria bacterium]|nr:MAG: hypothetical protein DMG98_18875 [Acidobacteriota bacterium]
MRQSQLPIVGLILAVLFGIRIGFPGSQPSQTGPVPSTRSEKQRPGKPVPVEEFPPVWEALCKLNPQYGSMSYLSRRKILEKVSPDGYGDPSCLQNERNQRLQLDILSMIAAVPDPVHTHLGSSFDRTIDAIQAAASEGNPSYLPYLSALPWPPPQLMSDASGQETVSSYQYPGVLVFRKSEPHSKEHQILPDEDVPRFLVVFLVPELPTSGIDRTTFLAAVRIMYKISPTSSNYIALLGPNFSGSVDLLSQLRDATTVQLRAVPARSRSARFESQACIKAVSGSVTNPPNRDPFEAQQAPTSCASRFIALQTRDDEAIASFITSMYQSKGYCPSEIAILTEDGTGYGNLNSTKIRTAESGCEHKQGALFLHFPREISKVRNTYGSPLDQQSPNEKNQAPASTALSLHWQDAHPFIRDDVRNYGGEQTAVSEETVLASLATVIKSQRIKALGILATDPLDTAFLIHSFRKSSPDVRIFLRDPDLLYLRTPDIGSTNGIMVINNFPLIPQNQFWSQTRKDADHPILLPSALQEAEYNAFALLLQDKLFQLRFHPPLALPMFDPLDGAWPAGPQGSFDAWLQDKPLWLGVTGTAGYYPLGILNRNRTISAHEQAAALRSLKVGRPPYATIVLLCLIALLGFLHALWSTFPAIVPSWFEEEFDFSNKADAISVAKGFCHALALLSLSLGTLLVSSSFYFFRDTTYTLNWIPVYKGGAAIAVVLTPALVLAAAWRLFHSVFRPWRSFKSGISCSNSDGRKICKLFRSLPLVLAIFVAPIIYWFAYTSSSTFENAFLHYRDLYLASGVAPALPALLLVAIAYLGILAYLRRIANWEYGSVKTPALPLDETFPSDFSPNAEFIDEWMLGIPAASKKHVALFLLFFGGSVLALRPWATMDTLEGQWVYRFLVLGFIFAFFIISVNWIRFIAVWRQLRTILRGLERLPLRLAFGRLPRESSLPIWSWSIGTFLPIVPAVDTIRALVRVEPTAITADSAEKLRLGMLALANPQQWQKLQQLENEEELSRAAEQQAVNFIAQERERVVSFDEAPMAFVMTADGTVPVPLRRKESPRAPAGNVNPGNVTQIRPEPAEARATGAAAKITSTQYKEVMRETRKAMTEVIQELSGLLVREYWNRGGIGLRAQEPKSKVDPADRKYLLAEDLVALRFYSYIRYVVSELRSLIFFLALSFSLLFLTLHVYSFRAGQGIDWSFIVLFLVMGGGIFWVLVQMERDALLSRLQGTQANHLNKQFYVNLLKYGFVPFLTIMGSQVPAISNFLITKLQPSLEAFR